MDNMTPPTTEVYNEEVFQERAKQAWILRTQKGMSKTAIASRLGVDIAEVTRLLLSVSSQVTDRLADVVAEEKVFQVEYLHGLVADLHAQYEASKKGKDTITQVTSKPQAPEGQEINMGGVTTTTRQNTVSYGDMRIINQIRLCLDDVRKVLDIQPTDRKAISWRNHVPSKYDPETLANEFAQMMVSEKMRGDS